MSKTIPGVLICGNTCSVNTEAIQISVSRRHGCIFHDTVYEKHRYYRFTGVIIRTFSRGYDKKGAFFIPKRAYMLNLNIITICGIYDRKQ